MAITAANVTSDPRWRAFQEKGFACSCGQTHVGLFPIYIHHPISWPGSKDYEPDEALRMDGDFLSQNYCVLQGKFFCARVRVPVRLWGVNWAFTYAAWAAFDRPDFESYVHARKTGTLRTGPTTAGRLVNRLSGYPDTSMLMGTVFQEATDLPALILHGPQPDNSTGQLLMQEQKDGIGLDRALELFSLYKHDMRPAAG